MKRVEYIEDIAWLQELPADILNLEQAERVAFRKHQLLMTRHGIPSWAFLLSGSAQWLIFDPASSKVRAIGEIMPGQFLGPEPLGIGAIAVTTSACELLVLPRASGQSDPISRLKPGVRNSRTPANDIPFHAYHLDKLGHSSAGIDIGASSGNFSQLLAGYCDKVTAIEPNASSANLAVARMQALGFDNYSTLHSYAEALPLESESVDIVGCRMAVHQFQDQKAFAQEARRVLRLGGIVAITDLVAPTDPDATELLNQIERARDPTHEGVLSKEAMLGHFSSGFEVVATLDTVLRTPLIPWLEQAGIDEGQISDLRRDIYACDPRVREILGVSEDTKASGICFDSRRFSFILRKVQ